MPTAAIKINGVVGSNDDLSINVLVLLDNAGSGGESTYLWQITDQPEGTPDVLSSTNTQAPSFTPRKEGSYRLRLVVNQGQGTEQVSAVIAAVRQLKTRQRVPAAGETTEVDATRGFATAADRLFVALEQAVTGGQIVIGTAAVASLTRGTVLRATGTATLKSGLPGQESVPAFSKAQASTAAQVQQPLCVLEGGVDGSGAPANGAVIKARISGFFGPVAGSGATTGNPVFVSDAGGLSLAAGTTSRKVGTVTRAGASDYDVFLSCGGFA